LIKVFVVNFEDAVSKKKKIEDVDVWDFGK